MTLVQLTYFKKLASVLHYTKAAKELHISQPSLSYAINALEKELSVKLFDKANKTLRLSPYGESFLEYVNTALNSIDAGVKQIHLLQNAHTGTVRLGYIYSLSSNFLPKLIKSFKSHEAHLKIDFHFFQDLQDDLMKDLALGNIDLALCVGKDPNTISVPILEQDLYLIVPNTHPLSSKTEVSLLEIAEFPLILLHKNSGLHKLVKEKFTTENLTPKIVFEPHDSVAALQFVTNNMGITIIPEIPLIEELPVNKIKIKHPKITRKIYLSWSNTMPLNPAAKKVRDYILEQKFSL